METKTLTAALREGTGKGVARKTRAAGMIPAVMYGEDIESKPIAIKEKEFYGIIRSSASENILLELSIEGADDKPRTVLVKDIQHDPVDGQLLHIDFQQISLTKKIIVDIPIRIKGIAEGVKTMGGILEFIHRELAVACLPTDIMDFIEIDVSKLGIGDSIFAGDLDLHGVEMHTNPKQVLVTVAAPTVSKETEEAEAAEAEEGEAEAATEAEEGAKEAEPEVITEKKKEK